MHFPLGALTTLAWRNLWRNYRRTIIMLAAISIGVWAMIFMTALMRGMVDEMIKDSIKTLIGHVQIHHPLYRDDPNIVNSIAEPTGSLLIALNSPPIKAWGARIRVPAVISSERESKGVVMVGIEPTKEKLLSYVADNITEGRFLQDSCDKGVLIGEKMARQLETRLGKRIVLMSQDPDNNIVDRGFRIVGIYKAKLPSLEEQYVFIGLETARQLLQMPGLVSEIEAVGKDYRPEYVDMILQQIAKSAPTSHEVLPWYRIDNYMGTMLTVMDGFVVVWVVIIFAALSFGLVNTLVMAIFERVREIGLMQALGMKPSSIMIQILIESLFLLLLGLLIGNLLSVISIEPLKDGIDISVVAKGMEMMGSASILYPALKLSDVILANCIVITLGILASCLPAWHASRLKPIEAINKT